MTETTERKLPQRDAKREAFKKAAIEFYDMPMSRRTSALVGLMNERGKAEAGEDWRNVQVGAGNTAPTPPQPEPIGDPTTADPTPIETKPRKAA